MSQSASAVSMQAGASELDACSMDVQVCTCPACASPWAVSLSV